MRHHRAKGFFCSGPEAYGLTSTSRDAYFMCQRLSVYYLRQLDEVKIIRHSSFAGE